MKKRLSFIVAIIMMFGSTKIAAQVKIGDNPTTVNSASLLELETTNKGLLLPRLADTTSISNPPQGMFMFNNNDTSLYFRRLGGWRRLTFGDDNFWMGSRLEGSNNPLYIFDRFPVTVNVPANASTQSLAPFNTEGMFGNTLAMFGDGKYDNIAGISLVGNWPGIYFNSYYNGGSLNMAPGYSGNIAFDPNAGTYYFSFNDNATNPNTKVNDHPEMILTKDGKLGLNTGISSRAWMEEQGAVNNACAIFGGEGTGVAIEEHYPSIGFNSYYNGNGALNSINAGYSGEIGIDQNNGDFYLTSATGKSVGANQTYAGYVRSFNIAPNGWVGLNTLSPQSQLEIVQPIQSINPTNGLTFTSSNTESGSLGTTSFSISGYTGGSTELNGAGGPIGSDNFFPSAYLVFQNNYDDGSPSQTVANIDANGNYHQTSDARFKTDIASLNQNDMLQKLLLLKPSNYHFINQKETNLKSYGFLAQDVEQVFPEFVDEVQGKKMLAYSSFIPVIVAAMQEQQQEIETLKNTNRISTPTVQTENNDLKNQVAALTDMVKQLEQKVDALEKQVK